MLNAKQKVRKTINVLIKLLPLLAITMPILILYFYESSTHPNYSTFPDYSKSMNLSSFEMTWKGRTFYLFFLWLAFLEMTLSWESLQIKIGTKMRIVRISAVAFTLLLPTTYIIVANFYGLNKAIVDWAWSNNIAQCDWMPLAIEYLVLASLFAVTVLLQYGIGGLKNILISPLFLLTIGIIYTIDNVYPYGSFTPFQIFVPATASLAANVLTLMGYRVFWIGVTNGMPAFMIWNAQGRTSAAYSIAWPCSGIESLILYTVTILLFLKNTVIPLKHRIIYLAVGAVITFFVNVLRIVTIFVISVNTGGYTVEVQRFHDFYGQLYSIIWIVSYPLLIVGSRTLWGKIRKPEKATIGDLELPTMPY